MRYNESNLIKSVLTVLKEEHKKSFEDFESQRMDADNVSMAQVREDELSYRQLENEITNLLMDWQAELIEHYQDCVNDLIKEKK